MNGKLKNKVMAIFAVAMMIMVACVPMVSYFGGDDAEVAGATYEPILSDVKVQVFTDEADENFSDLIYCSNNNNVLPAGVDPTEYVEVSDAGVYINVNEKSSKYGTFLRYGDTGMTNEQIIAQSVDGGGWLPLIQVSFKYAGQQDISLSITGPSSKTGTDVAGSIEKAGITFDEVEAVTTFKLCQSGSNGTPYLGYSTKLDASGEYTITGTVNGITEINQKVSYSPANVISVSGTIYDSSTALTKIDDNRTTVTYTVDGTQGTVKTQSGVYTIYAPKNANIVITGITYDNGAYTFSKKLPYTFGPVSATIESTDFTNAVNFNANEDTLEVTFNDATGVAIGNYTATVSVNWYAEVANTTGSTYKINSLSGTVKQVDMKTNTNGKIRVAFVAPTTTTSAMIVTLSATNFSFNTTSIITGDTVKDSISTQAQNKDGMSVITNEIYSATIKAQETIYTVTVGSANYSASSSGAPVVGASVSAAWYTSENSSTSQKYKVTDVTSKGKAIPIGTTDESGKIWIAVIAPKDGSTAITASLVVSASAISPYTFDTVSIITGDAVEKQLTSQIENKNGTKVYVPGIVLNAKENAHIVSGTVTLDKATDKEIKVSYTEGIGAEVVLKGTTASRNYSFAVIEGKAPVVTVSCEGYKFNTASVILPSLYKDKTSMNFSGNKIVTEADLLPIGSGVTYIVSSLTAGDVVKFTYSIESKEYASTVVAKVDSNSLCNATLSINGTNGKDVKVSVESEGYFISSFVKSEITYNATAYEVVEKAISVVVGQDPAIGYTIEVYFGIDKVTSVTSNEEGYIVFNGPTIDSGTEPALNYKYNGFEVVTISEGAIDLAKFASSSESGKITLSVSYLTSYIYDVGNMNNFGSVAPSQHITAEAGTTVKLYAPDYEGYKFICWMVNGEKVSDSAEYSYTAVEGDDVRAIYGADAAVPGAGQPTPSQGIDGTTMVLGIAAVVVAILGLAFVIIKRD